VSRTGGLGRDIGFQFTREFGCFEQLDGHAIQVDALSQDFEGLA